MGRSRRWGEKTSAVFLSCRHRSPLCSAHAWPGHPWIHAGRAGEDTEGDYHGYLSDAAELAKRLEHRGYAIVRAGRDR
jgi:hypothetical protein